jgi:phosphatidylserine/phosphatidylglycerophosphate/cardiolipin synthase-like enzyme
LDFLEKKRKGEKKGEEDKVLKRGGKINMKTEEVSTSDETKEKIIGLLQRAKSYVWMSSGLNSDFYNSPDIKKAIIDVFGRVKEVKILIEGDAEKKKSEVGWFFEEAKKNKEKIRIRQCGTILHWLIVDGKHFRLEKPHPIGVVGVDNLVVYNVDPPVISEFLMRKFDRWWGMGSPVDP